MKSPDPKLEDEARVAETKFEESKEMAWNGMATILENDGEQVSQLYSMVQAQLAFHENAVSILQGLNDSLRDMVQDAQARPGKTFARAPAVTGGGDLSQRYDDDDDDDLHGSQHYDDSDYNAGGGAADSADGGAMTATAIYDFEAENDGELNFREGDQITLLSRLDENWIEGSIYNQTGIFPSTYVECPPGF